MCSGLMLFKSQLKEGSSFGLIGEQLYVDPRPRNPNFSLNLSALIVYEINLRRRTFGFSDGSMKSRGGFTSVSACNQRNPRENFMRFNGLACRGTKRRLADGCTAHLATGNSIKAEPSSRPYIANNTRITNKSPRIKDSRKVRSDETVDGRFEPGTINK